VNARERIETLRRDNPSFKPWLALLEVALEAASDPTWEEAARGVAASPERPALAGATIRVDGRQVVALLDRLLGAATDETRAAAPSVGLDPARWLGAALGPDAGLLGGNADLLPIADLVALPLLLACGRRFADRCKGWSDGVCPICGGWPTLAELRGLERSRRLRCGRCGADWGLLPLHCPFCDNIDHEKLKSLVPESGGESRRVEVCERCRGYVKTLAQLAAIKPELVPLEDLGSVELDLAAIERDYRRPEGPRQPLGVAIEVT
jgi:FdhE protein